MTDTITIAGNTGSAPSLQDIPSGQKMATFRVASPNRRRDPKSGEWTDLDPNWYSVVAFGALAENAASSLAKGQRVIVSGRLRVRRWERGDRQGTDVEITAESIGVDLRWGTATFTRGGTTSSPSEEPAPSAHDENGDGWAAPGAGPEASEEFADAVPY